MRGVRGGYGVTVPDGWSKASFFGRLVTEGMCSYDKLVDGTLSANDVFEMHRMLDFKLYCDLKAQERVMKNGRR